MIWISRFATAIRRRRANFQWPSVYGGNNTSDPYILASAGSPAVGSVHVIAVVGILGLNARRCLDDKTTPAETPEQMLSPPSLSRKIWYACWYNRTQLFLFAVPSFSLIPLGLHCFSLDPPLCWLCSLLKESFLCFRKLQKWEWKVLKINWRSRNQWPLRLPWKQWLSSG